MLAHDALIIITYGHIFPDLWVRSFSICAFFFFSLWRRILLYLRETILFLAYSAE